MKSRISWFRKKLIDWFQINQREFPWRNSNNPYEVLMAEMMLRRTRADQVVPVYQAFLERFPSAEELDKAGANEVAEVLYPLGLNWRIPAFKELAEELSKYKYQVPDSREELVKLPGVGDYVAGAVLCFSFGKTEWIVDTNVARVFKRFLGVVTIKEARRDNQIIMLSKHYSKNSKPRMANFAILDFAAVTCKSRDPDCEVCPVRERCEFLLAIDTQTNYGS